MYVTSDSCAPLTANLWFFLGATRYTRFTVHIEAYSEAAQRVSTSIHDIGSASETYTDSGGKLILMELHNDAVARAGFMFGLLPGWWLSKP